MDSQGGWTSWTSWTSWIHKRTAAGGDCGDPLLSEALIRNRGGLIADAFDPEAVCKPAFTELDDHITMRQWEPVVRLYTYMSDIFSNLRFSVDEKTEIAQMTHLHVVGSKATNLKLLHIKRPDRATFEAQLRLVHGWAQLREERSAEILVETAPQTPFWSAIAGIHPDRHRYTLELVNIAMAIACIVSLRFKHSLSCPRPYHYSTQIQPMLQTPGHGSLPSGHASEAFVVAEVLAALTGNPKVRNMLISQAARIAINRSVAGVHFPIDSAAGEMLGTTVAEYLTHLGEGGDGWTERAFEVVDVNQNFLQDRSTRKVGDPVTDVGINKIPKYEPSTDPAVPNSPFNWLWQKAKAEWS